MLDKMTRVENTVAELTLILGINERMIPIIKDAAALAMSDLATSVVTEFTSLAGIMARHYALRDGIPEEVVILFSCGVNLVPTCLSILSILAE